MEKFLVVIRRASTENGYKKLSWISDEQKKENSQFFCSLLQMKLYHIFMSPKSNILAPTLEFPWCIEFLHAFIMGCDIYIYDPRILVHFFLLPLNIVRDRKTSLSHDKLSTHRSTATAGFARTKKRRVSNYKFMVCFSVNLDSRGKVNL